MHTRISMASLSSQRKKHSLVREVISEDGMVAAGASRKTATYKPDHPWDWPFNLHWGGSEINVDIYYIPIPWMVWDRLFLPSPILIIGEGRRPVPMLGKSQK